MSTPAAGGALPGWERARDCSISMQAAGLLALIPVVPIVAILAWLYAALWGWRSLGAGLAALNLWVVLPALLVAIALHELVHGVTWALLSGKPLSAIRCGFNVASLTPFAHCREPLPIRPYIVGVLMPGLALGVLPCLAALLLGYPTVMLGGLAMTAVAGGDMLIVWLLRGAGPRSLVQDHPTRAGCWVLDDPAGR